MDMAALATPRFAELSMRHPRDVSDCQTWYGGRLAAPRPPAPPARRPHGPAAPPVSPRPCVPATPRPRPHGSAAPRPALGPAAVWRLSSSIRSNIWRQRRSQFLSGHDFCVPLVSELRRTRLGCACVGVPYWTRPGCACVEVPCLIALVQDRSSLLRLHAEV